MKLDVSFKPVLPLIILIIHHPSSFSNQKLMNSLWFLSFSYSTSNLSVYPASSNSNYKFFESNKTFAALGFWVYSPAAWSLQWWISLSLDLSFCVTSSTKPSLTTLTWVTVTLPLTPVFVFFITHKKLVVCLTSYLSPLLNWKLCQLGWHLSFLASTVVPNTLKELI